MSLFIGPKAVENILKVTKHVNAQLIEQAKTISGGNFLEFQPWMSIPHQIINWTSVPNWPISSKPLNNSELQQIANVIQKIEPNIDGKIPTTENFPIKIAALTSDQLNIFYKLVDEAHENLFKVLPETKILINELVHQIVPITFLKGKPFPDFGMSALWLKGVIFFESSQNISIEQRTENLAHELAHQIINQYLLTDSIIAGNLNQPIYSGIRETPRPAIMAFHGAAALANMLRVARAFNNKTRAAELNSALQTTTADLSKISLTQTGSIIFKEILQQIK